MRATLPIAAILLAGLMPSPTFAQALDPLPDFRSIVIRSNNANPLYATTGDDITVLIETTKEVVMPVVRINGRDVLMTDTGPTSFEGTYPVPSDEQEGTAGIYAEITDSSGQTSATLATTDGVYVIVDRTPPVLDITQLPDEVVEATDPRGTIVAYDLPYAIGEDAPLPATCTPGLEDGFSLGTTALTCYAEDRAGNISGLHVLMNVTVVDTTAPTIALISGETVTTTQGSTFIDPGATVTDNGDEDPILMIDGTVDTATLGTYVLTYTATDGSGNSATVTRTVTVIEPVRSGGGGGSGNRRTQNEDDAEEPEGEVLGVSTEAPPQGEVLGASAYAFIRHLRQGDTGEDVAELQKLLGTLGYLAHPPTGYFGPLTASALSVYQKAHGLDAVGYVGPRTLALLNTGTLATDPKISLLIAEIARLNAEIAKLKAL